ncbi:MAG: hypothetical protein RIT81_05065 [Deltaproteobacteria bacterium]
MNRTPSTTNLLNKLLGVASAVSMCAVLGVASEARAERPAPELDLGDKRVTAVAMDDFHESRIVRERTPGKKAVTFSAMNEKIDAKAEVVFEIRSESSDRDLPRWRCVARKNVNECFDKPVRIAYLANDDRVVMSVRVQKRSPILANR